jgi:23S rRNA-/tRNA-specific pseudouridylate synthase
MSSLKRAALPVTISTSLTDTLQEPEVIADGKRWLVINKPAGWSVTTISSSPSTPSLQSVYGASLDCEEVFFPLRINRNMAGLVLACTDRGMNAQMIRHLQTGRIHRRYRAICHSGPDVYSEPPVTIEAKGNGLCLADISATKMTSRQIQDLLYEALY